MQLDYSLDLLADHSLLPILLQMFVLALAVWIEPYILKHQKQVMAVIIVLVLTNVLDNMASDYLMELEGASFARVIESIYGYSVRPVLIVLFYHLIAPGKRHWIAWGIAGMNAAIHLTALFSPAVFWISEDNHYHRGTLGYTAHVTSTVLIVYLAVLSIREWRQTRKAETAIPILNALLIIGAVLMDSFIVNVQTGMTYLTVAMVSSSLFYYIWLHLKFVRDHEDELIIRQRMQIMLSQIQPHFLYNTLGAIRELCDDPRAKKAVGDFTRYLQGNMDVLARPGAIPFTVELEHTRAYLELEQLRFESELRVEYDITCTDFELPTLTLQPIVENAVRHGARGMERELGTVMIATRELPDCFEILVTDDGPGFDPEHPVPKDDGRAHIGIPNVRQRLQEVCGGELHIESEPGRGTKVTFLLPKKSDGIATEQEGEHPC